MESGTRYNAASTITDMIDNYYLTFSLREDEKLGALNSVDIKGLLVEKAKKVTAKTDAFEYKATKFHEKIWVNAFLIFINGGAVAFFLFRSRNTKIQSFRPITH